MIIKNVNNGIELNLKNAEENDIYYVSITKNKYNLTIRQYPKHTWIKVNDKDDYLRLILKDINKIHMFGFSDIKEIYNDTDMIIFRLYSSDIRTASLSYVKESKEVYYDCCKIESDDLKSSIEGYLSLLK
jgi:hypothetical protein